MRTRTTTVVVAAVLLMAGCSGGGDEEVPSGGGGAGTGVADGPDGAGSDDDAAAQEEDATGGEEADADVARAPVATIPAEPVAAAPGLADGMVLEAYALTRSGDTVTLVMGVLNEGEERFSISQSFDADVTESQSRSNASGISLLDPVNLNRHMVLRDTEGQCLCSELILEAVEPGARAHLSASFAAPPEDVTAMTVETPSGSITDVPVTEAS